MVCRHLYAHAFQCPGFIHRLQSPPLSLSIEADTAGLTGHSITLTLCKAGKGGVICLRNPAVGSSPNSDKHSTLQYATKHDALRVINNNLQLLAGKLGQLRFKM